MLTNQEKLFDHSNQKKKLNWVIRSLIIFCPVSLFMNNRNGTYLHYHFANSSYLFNLIILYCICCLTLKKIWWNITVMIKALIAPYLTLPIPALLNYHINNSGIWNIKKMKRLENKRFPFAFFVWKIRTLQNFTFFQLTVKT